MEAILQYGEALRLDLSDAQACPGIKRLTGGLVRYSRDRSTNHIMLKILNYSYA